MKRNTTNASTSKELFENIKKYLVSGKEKGYYIVDRNKCSNFGLIFKDGICSYSAIDLFCERIYKKSIVKKLKKNVDTLSDDDQAIVDEYLKATEYLSNLPKDIAQIDADKTNYYSMVANDLPVVIRGIETTKKEIEMPFYVNSISGEEFPLVCLGDATDEEIERWAQKLTAFVEINKELLTPAAFSPYVQPDGLKVMKVNSPLWIDIVVR